MLYRLLAGSLIGLATLAPTTIGSSQDREIPSVIIKVVKFSDHGRTYMVDLESGRVTVDDGEAQPDPTPSGIQADIKAAFIKAIPASRRKAAASCLWESIELTLAEAGGLGHDAQEIIDNLKVNADFVCDQNLKGFDLGSVFAKNGVSDKGGVIKALRETMTVLETLK